MAWVAFDRAAKLARMRGQNDLAERWEPIRDTIHREICDKAFHQEKRTFTQFYGSETLDASVLLMTRLGFLPHDDPRIVSTVEAIERELTSDGLLMRYDNREAADDGLPPGEGMFLACSFWLVSSLKLIGRDDDARALFERLLALRNDVGLLAEEYDTQAKRQVGNFPQAFSHLALIGAAFALGGNLSHQG